MNRALSDTPAGIRAALVELHQAEPPRTLSPKALKAHLLVHELVEKQLLENDPPEAGQALERLMDQGLTRHEAAHRLGEAAARHALDMLKKGTNFDRAAYLQALRAL
jgi:hypothetical protein